MKYSFLITYTPKRTFKDQISAHCKYTHQQVYLSSSMHIYMYTYLNICTTKGLYKNLLIVFNFKWHVSRTFFTNPHTKFGKRQQLQADATQCYAISTIIVVKAIRLWVGGIMNTKYMTDLKVLSICRSKNCQYQFVAP